MGHPTLIICRRCEPDDADDEALTGEALYRAVKARRKALGLKDVFDVEGVKCLGLCRTPCNLVFEGPKRSTYTRSHVHPIRELEAVVSAARAYAALSPGDELPERRLPGLSGD
jgi:predicted metal-binding protein